MGSSVGPSIASLRRCGACRGLLSLSPALVAQGTINLRCGHEKDRSGRPAGSSDDAGCDRPGPDRRPSRPSPRPPPRPPRRPKPLGRQVAGAAAGRPSHHRPAPAGLRAAAAGDRARRNRRHARPAHGARQRDARPLPAHLPGAGGRPVRPGRRRDRPAQGQDADGLCRRPAPAEPGPCRELRPARQPGCRTTTTIPTRRRSTGWRSRAARPARAS